MGEAKAFGYEGTLAVRFSISKISPDQQRISHVGGIRLSNGHDTNDTFGVEDFSAGQRFGWGRPAPR